MTQTLSGLTPATPTPLVTFYDCSSGERTELSGITMNNWVAKVSNFLVDDLDAEIGSRLRIDLPNHWLRYVWFLSAWNIGVVVADSDCEIGLCGPELTSQEPVKLASALTPFGLPFRDAPAGFLDIGAEVPSHSDHFEPFDPPTSDVIAWDLAGQSVTHGEALDSEEPPISERVLIADTSLDYDAKLLIRVLRGGGSLIVVRHGSAEDIEQISRQEIATPVQ